MIPKKTPIQKTSNIERNKVIRVPNFEVNDRTALQKKDKFMQRKPYDNQNGKKNTIYEYFAVIQHFATKKENESFIFIQNEDKEGTAISDVI